jgi:hypothetical protein
MTVRRLMAIALIYALASAAWVLLAGSLVVRTGELDDRLAREVALLWGGPHAQAAPAAWIERPTTTSEAVQESGPAGQPVTRTVTRPGTDLSPVALESGRVNVELQLDHRRKGLLWYDTYGVDFAGSWRARNPDTEPRRFVVELKFPSAQAMYDRFRFTVNGVEGTPVKDFSQGARATIELPPGGEAVIEAAYRSRGLDRWVYTFSESGVAQVKDFTLSMRTDFSAIDFPAGTMSPTAKTARPGGWDLAWRFDHLVTGQRLGMDLPNRVNPGPLAARITWFAPVSLLFFLAVMVILGVLHGRSLHPMHYAFVSAGFFAFHLLLAYLVDRVDLHVSFVLASLVSVGLVVSYLYRAAGAHEIARDAAVAQLVYLVLFSYAFFFDGYTGLTVTIGAILTLFALMQATARLDWNQVFAGQEAS